MENLIKKIDNKEELTENEIKELLWNAKEVYEEEGEDHRWQREIFSVVEVNGRFFAIAWMRGLTESQENDYCEQPYEVGCENKTEIVNKQIWKPISEVKQETSNALITVEQLPVIRERLEALSVEIDEKVNNALSLVCTEETRKDVKEVRATLNKQKAELEEQRKQVKKLVLDPYNRFEEIYKKCVTEKFNYADSELKNKIDVVENGIKEEKRQEAINYFDEYKTNLKIDFVKFEDMNLNITLTLTKSNIQKSIKEYLDKIYSDLDVISIQDHKDEMLVEYKSNGYDCNKAITTVLNRIALIEREKEIQEKQKAEAEQIQQNIENIQKAIEPEVAAPISAPVVEAKEYVVNFKVIATKEKLVELKKFLNDGGYKYE